MSTPLNISLSQQGFDTDAMLYCNLGTAPLVEAALANNEGILAKDGPLVVKTGAHTGRSAKDKYIVRDSGCPGHRRIRFDQPADRGSRVG